MLGFCYLVWAGVDFSTHFLPSLFQWFTVRFEMFVMAVSTFLKRSGLCHHMSSFFIVYKVYNNFCSNLNKKKIFAKQVIVLSSVHQTGLFNLV